MRPLHPSNLGILAVTASLLRLSSAILPRSRSQKRYGDEEKKTFLSTPVTDPDLAARDLRLSYRAPYWEYVDYSTIDPSLVGIPFAAPGGDLGSAQELAEAAIIAGQLTVSKQVGAEVFDPMTPACTAIDPDLACIESLDSYEPLYRSLAPEFQPAAYKFWDSDYAFARERITSSPLFIKLVAELSDVPFTQSDVVGYNEITGGVSMAQLVAQERVFIVDFTPYYDLGLLQAAPNSFLEVPVAVFFLDDNPNKTGKKDSLRLMPLAIKFTVYNQNVYSPMDTHADWFLAKAIFNTLDVNINAIVHFVLHFVIVNIEIAAQKNLANEHPLFRPIQLASALNNGIIRAGVVALLKPGTGEFDKFMYLNGTSIQTKLLPYLLDQFDWKQSYLWMDLHERGVTDLPGFLYRDDASAIYKNLDKYVRSYLNPFYKKPASVSLDEELQDFIRDLSSNSSALSYIPGFPTTNEVKNIKDVTEILTQVLWMTGAAHHALNSYRITNFDFVYPSHPGKILSAPIATKGVLTDDDVLHQYIAKPFPIEVRRRRRSLQEEKREEKKEIEGGGRERTLLPLFDDKVFKHLYGPSDKAIQAAQEVVGEGISLPPFFGFLFTQLFGFAFWPLLQKTDRLTNIYFSDTSYKKAIEAYRLRTDLIKLSEAIQKREEKTKNVAPKYLLLDPQRLPFYLYI